MINRIRSSYPNKKASYLFHVYRPYFKNIRNLKSELNSYEFILSYLKTKDYLWCVIQIFKLLKFKPSIPKCIVNKKTVNLYPLIKNSIIDEISKGVVDNLLLFRAFLRLSKTPGIKMIIYPFENKSLEKLMLIALNNNFKSIGYQHSSITPRHFSLILDNDEIELYPLPKKIITTGEITKNWLISKGNFPKEKIVVGVGLRNSNFKYLEKKISVEEKYKLLFSFSSGFHEIYDSINFLKNIKERHMFDIRFRFQPDFLFDKLLIKEKKWIKSNKIEISKKEVLQDFKWADITCYISSSVAIESILHNVPIIHLNIDKYDCDPFMGEKLPMKWSVDNQEEFLIIISKILKINKFERRKRYLKAKKFIDSYFISDKQLNLKVFLES